MKIIKIAPVLLLILVTAGFFFKTVVYRQIPFPGDLLIAEYKPWQAFSYLGYNPGAVPNKAQYPDTLRQIYPWKTLVINSIKRGQLPLWNPYNFSGTPLLANFQSAVFYPLNVFYLLFPQVTAWTILVILQPLLASIFTYLYCKKIGCGSWGSWMAAISYGFSGFMTVWLEYNSVGHAILWLPLILLISENLSNKITFPGVGLFIFALVSSLFAGHPQVFGYVFIFVLAYIFYRQGVSKKSFYLGLLAFLALGIGAIQLIPGLELILLSARSSHNYSDIMQKILIQPWQLVMLFVPDFFGNPATRNYWLTDTYVGKVTSIGVVPLFFALFALANQQKKLVKFYLKTALVILLLISANPLSAVIYRLPIPLLTSSSPTLMIFLFSFSLSILAGFGLEMWLNQPPSYKKFFSKTLPIIFIFLGLWLTALVILKLPGISWAPYLKISLRNLVLPTAVAFAVVLLLWTVLRKPSVRHLLLILVLLLNIAELRLQFQKFNPFSPKEFIYPNNFVFDFLHEPLSPDRFWGYGHAAIAANFATQYAIFSPDGYDPLYPRWYGELIQASRQGKIITEFTDQTRSDAIIAPGFGASDLPSNHHRLRLLDALGVKYVLDRVENAVSEKTFHPQRFQLIFEKDGWRIFENRYSAPRIFLTSDYRTYKNKDGFEKLFFAYDFNPATTILLPEKIDYALSPVSNGSVTLLTYEPNSLTLAVNTNGQLLYLSDVYYPGWKALVDGKSTRIYRANYAFRAIYLPAGQHLVRFVFDPPSSKIGLIVSGLSLGCIILTLIYRKRWQPDL